MQAGNPRPTVAPGGWVALLLLLLGYMLNFVDRQIIAVLATPIKADLALSDTQLGLLGGTAFALLYTLAGLPIAVYADRSRRVTIVSIAIAMWSAFTCICGLTHSFIQLFFARVGVGLGEAGGTAPSHSLISDFFPKHLRATALSIFTLGVPIGSAMGIYLGGMMAADLGWRWALIGIGAVGLPLAALVMLLVKEPPRGRFDPDVPLGAAPRVGMFTALGQIAKLPGFWFLSLGAAGVAIPFSGIAFWLPSLLERQFHLTPSEVPAYFATIVLSGGILGLLIGGQLGDRLESRWRGSSILAVALLEVLAAPTAMIGAWAPSREVAWVMFALSQAFSISFTGPVVAMLQRIAGPPLRTVASASYLFVSNLAGLGLGAVVIGFISDHTANRPGGNALGQAMTLTAGLFVVGAALFVIGFYFVRAAERSSQEGN